MRNTGILYSSTERKPVVLPELAELLPPLSGEQLAALEADLLRNGCYSPIIVNEDLAIVDGHNRQRLCEEHGLPYGMNVNLKKMARVCPDAYVVGPAVLEDYELLFHGNTAGNGLETIARKTGSKVHGVLWRITQEGENSLDVYEGYPNLYNKRQVLVHDRNGREFSVMAYVMADDRFPQTARPSSYNYKVILEGYQQNGLPIAALKKAWQHCVQEARREAVMNQMKNWGFQTKKPKGTKGHER